MSVQINRHEETRLKILRLVEENPEITQREMAEELETSLGGINYCLRALVEKGWVKMDNFSRNPNKLKYAYLLTPRGIKAKSKLTASFLKRKLAEYEMLSTEIEQLKSEMKTR